MDELVKIKGVGQATATKLVAAGFNSVALLAAADPQSPPEGVQSKDWTAWIASAQVMPLASAIDTAIGTNADQNKPGETSEQSIEKMGEISAPKILEHPPEATPGATGPQCLSEVRYGGKTYGVGENLPTRIETKVLARLSELGAIPAD